MSAAVANTSSAALGHFAPGTQVPPAVRRGAWQIAHGQALSLRAGSASVLRVRQGRIWVTRDATTHWGSEDIVLAPGESLSVPAGQRLVMEAWDGHGATYTWDAA